MNQSPDHPITKLPGTPEWQGKPQEAKALHLRILTHLTRQAAEAGAAIPFRTLDARDLGRAICLLQHCFHGQFACMVCRSWIGPRLIAQLEEKALAADERR